MNEKLAGIDLNLLVALEALLKERQVTAAGKRVGLSQPAMSRALQRLRLLFDDKLILISRSGVQLTPKAAQLEKDLPQILESVRTLLHDGEEFNPKLARTRFRIVASELSISRLTPRLVLEVGKLAPNVSIEFLPLSVLKHGQSHNQIDFVIAKRNPEMAHLPSESLGRETFVCVMDPEHPLAKGSCMTLEQFLNTPQILWTPLSARGKSEVDSLLEQQGKERQVQLKIPNLVLAFETLSSRRHIMVAPRSLALKWSTKFDLKLSKLPVNLEPYELILAWEERVENSGAHSWLRDQMIRCFD